MTVEDKCSACGAVRKAGLSLMAPEPAPRCATCGAALAADETEQPYTIEFAFSQRVHPLRQNEGGVADPALRAQTAVSPDVLKADSKQQGETP